MKFSALELRSHFLQIAIGKLLETNKFFSSTFNKKFQKLCLISYNGSTYPSFSIGLIFILLQKQVSQERIFSISFISHFLLRNFFPITKFSQNLLLSYFQHSQFFPRITFCPQHFLYYIFDIKSFFSDISNEITDISNEITK